MKEDQHKVEIFTKQGAILGFVSYLIVLMIIFLLVS